MNQANLTDAIALTPQGRADLENELRVLRNERLPALAARLADAREDPATRDEDAGLLELQEEQRRLAGYRPHAAGSDQCRRPWR